MRRVGYAIASGSYALYVERALPPVQLLKEASKSAFAGLNFALYIGRAPSPSHLLGADTDTLPLTGRTASVIIPFGSLVHLVRGLSDRSARWQPPRQSGLPRGRWSASRSPSWAPGPWTGWPAAGGGPSSWPPRIGPSTASSEASPRPCSEPSCPRTCRRSTGLEVGVRYRSGVEGVDVGGDWCDLVELGDSRVLLVVGDVSGRGLRAATTMASLALLDPGLCQRG